jgi:fermentation-respiration switch protein FrsA (DUF1100 family)
MRLLYTFLAICLLVYLVYIGYFWFFQRSILFPHHLLPAPPAPAEGYVGLEQIWLATEQGAVEAWYLPPLTWDAGQPAPLFIVGHGNGELIDLWLQPVTELRQMGVGVLLVEYPGYGRSAGIPSQAAINETFLAAYDMIIEHPTVDSERIVLFGRSVGGSAVSLLATQRPSAALILFSTFSSIRALAAERYLPGFGVRDPFDTLTVVRGYAGPVLVIHGAHDQLIPYAHAVALSEAAQEGELITLTCGHNDCVEDWTLFWRSLRPFLVRAGILS